MDRILNKLNDEQKHAVVATDGPIIVLAGAGSGKTRVLIHRVWYLIAEKNVHPGNILMVTFTNKAAGEMKERIQKLLGRELSSVSSPIIGTFHALCAKILRRDGHTIGITNRFKIYDTQDQLDVIKEAMSLLDISIKSVKPRAVHSMISSAKNQMIPPEVYKSFARRAFQEAVALIYPLYQTLLKDADALDFDDLLLEAIHLFKTAPHVLSKYQNQFKYIMVDEYQDTNQAQYVLTKLLGGKYRNICIVGDFSQSIYSFRGADYRNLEKFKHDFPDAVTFPLSQNYRSTQKILDAAYSIISKNTLHPVLSLWTENHGGEDIELYEAEDEHDEAEFIIRKVLEAKREDPTLKFSDVAVLYRMNAQSRALEEVFLHESIPYVLVGGTRFYERREVKDVLSYLSYLANQKDKVALRRIEKIGKKRMQDFLEYIEESKEENKPEKIATIEILDEIIRKTSYLELYDAKDPEDLARLENIRELRSVAIEFPRLLEFLENVALVEQEYMPDKTARDTKPDAIILMTLHAAKGLEFKMVFIVGMEEGLFPHSQSLMDFAELEEERRLCYVGVTRAKQKLYMTFARRRLFFGQRIQGTLSRFILELPEEYHEFAALRGFSDEPDFL